MQTIRNRSFFLAQLGGAVGGLGLLAACGGNVMDSPTALSTTDKMLRDLGAYGVLHNNVYLRRSDAPIGVGHLDSQFILTGPSPCASDDPNCGGNNPPPVQQLPTIIHLVAYGGNSGSLNGNDLGQYTIWGGIYEGPTIGPWYGPVYQTPHISWACVAGAVQSSLAALGGIAQQILKDPGKYGAAAGQAGLWVRGAITASEFAAALLSMLGPAELAGLLLAAGIAVSSLALLIYCLKGGN